MPNWVLRLVASWVYPWVISKIAARNRNDRALLAALRAYHTDNSFLGVVGAYSRMTANLDDDKIIDGIEQFISELKTRPFKEIVEQYGKLFKVPDFDGDPDNDQTVAGLLDKIVQESVKE